MRIIGRYEVLELLGRGGMASVHLARDPQLERLVALKELASVFVDDASLVARFMRESRLAGAMNHPNIVTVLEYFEHDGVPFIAMEYLERGSLRPRIGTLSLAQIAGALEGVLAGLGEAAGQGIVHRDLKPENVLVSAQGTVKIADFGIAKAIDQYQSETGVMLTAAGQTIGTPAYMAPEQAMAQELGPRTDLYSVGVMAYELMSGRTPFREAESPMALLMAHVNDPPPPLASLVPDLDPRIAGWVHGLLAKDPGGRPASAQEAWDALDDVLLDGLGPRWRRDARLVETSDLAPVTPLPPTSPPSSAPLPPTGAAPTMPPARAMPPAPATPPAPITPPAPATPPAPHLPSAPAGATGSEAGRTHGPSFGVPRLPATPAPVEATRDVLPAPGRPDHAVTQRLGSDAGRRGAGRERAGRRGPIAAAAALGLLAALVLTLVLLAGGDDEGGAGEQVTTSERASFDTRLPAAMEPLLDGLRPLGDELPRLAPDRGPNDGTAEALADARTGEARARAALAELDARTAAERRLARRADGALRATRSYLRVVDRMLDGDATEADFDGGLARSSAKLQAALEELEAVLPAASEVVDGARELKAWAVSERDGGEPEITPTPSPDSGGGGPGPVHVTVQQPPAVTSHDGGPVEVEISASATQDGRQITPDCAPPGPYAVGATTVTCTATGRGERSASRSVTVTVEDGSDEPTDPPTETGTP